MDKRIEKKTLELHELRPAQPAVNGNGNGNGHGNGNGNNGHASGNGANGAPGATSGVANDQLRASSLVAGTIGPAHATGYEPYYIGVFLLGAYQEILGDLHNLLGDTHAVHVSYNPEGGASDSPDGGYWSIDEVVEGDTVKEVLQYVQYDTEDMFEAVRKDVERAIKLNRLTVSEGKAMLMFYEQGMDGYTYLEE